MNKDEFHKLLNERNEATRVWIKAETATRTYCHKIETMLNYCNKGFRIVKRNEVYLIEIKDNNYISVIGLDKLIKTINELDDK